MSPIKRTAYLVATIVMLAVPFVVWWKAQALTDWWQLRGYMPPANVAALVAQDTLTPYARHIFYVNHPQVVTDAATFRKDCPQSEQTIVLGCYHSDQLGIDIYAVQDIRLNGVQQVTSAHEMLHAAYDRLSSSDKNHIDGLLQDFYQNDLKDQRIIDTINSYRQTEPNDVVNEMHSIFGTEVPNLPAPLENYYKRYFVNRAAVIGFSENYEGEFTSRKAEIAADDARLASMKQQIDSEEVTLSSQLKQIESDRTTLDALRSSGQIDQYNARVPGFNAEVDAYNAGVSRLKTDISAYNTLVDQRNAIATDLETLTESLDSRSVPQQIQ